MSRLWSCKSLGGLPRFRPSTSCIQVPPRVGSIMTPRGLVLSASERACHGPRNASSSTRPFRHLTVDSCAWQGPHETRLGTGQTSTSPTYLSSQIKQLNMHRNIPPNISPPHAASTHQTPVGRRFPLNTSGSQTDRGPSNSKAPTSHYAHGPWPPKTRSLIPLTRSARAQGISAVSTPRPPPRSAGSHRWGDVSPRVKVQSHSRSHVVPGAILGP